jgi:hypothetical protein
MSDEEVRYALSEIVSSVLERMAAPDQRDRLRARMRDRFPNRELVDDVELGRITELAAAGLLEIRARRRHGLERMVIERFMVDPAERIRAGG